MSPSVQISVGIRGNYFLSDTGSTTPILGNCIIWIILNTQNNEWKQSKFYNNNVGIFCNLSKWMIYQLHLFWYQLSCTIELKSVILNNASDKVLSINELFIQILRFERKILFHNVLTKWPNDQQHYTTINIFTSII